MKVRSAYVFFRLLEYECVATEDCGDEDLKFHVGEVLAHTCPIPHQQMVWSGPPTSNAGSLIGFTLTLGRTRTD